MVRESPALQGTIVPRINWSDNRRQAGHGRRNLGYTDPVPLVGFEVGCRILKMLVAQHEVRKHRNMVLLGDSFTAGYHGGIPWVSDLRSKLGSAVAIFFSLSLSGTGIREFEQQLNNFSASVPVDDVYILFITKDFYRRLWYPASKDNEFWFRTYAESKDECLSAKAPTSCSLTCSGAQMKFLQRQTRYGVDCQAKALHLPETRELASGRGCKNFCV